MDARLDHSSPIPLYHQLAEALHWRISTGELRPGERLPSLRAAAAELGVNLHTVRAAYAVLIREGLLESKGSRGTRVVQIPRPEERPPRTATELVQRFRQQAWERFRIGSTELARLVAELPEGAHGRAVWVVECSAAQCRDHVLELEERLGVTASPWCLDQIGEPPPGTVVSTYFHYADVLRRWPHRRDDTVFVAVHPDSVLREEVEQRFPESNTLVACELDAARAANLAADLRGVFGDRWELEAVGRSRPADALELEAPICFSPRAWAELGDAGRASRWAVRVRYVLAGASLHELSRRLQSTG